MKEKVKTLEFSRVSHAFGAIQALTKIDLSIQPGEVVCLVGPSGCGKSTLLRLAAGLEMVQSGSIAMKGRIVGDETGRHIPPEHRHVGLVFQDFALFPHLTVAGNVGFGLRGNKGEDNNRRITEILEHVGLAEIRDSYPSSLSGGEQQRVALARALAPAPSLMLMDEPFSGLDARLREQVRDDTLEVLRQNHAATLLVTHDPEEALFMADRLYLLREGRIVQSGLPQEIYRHPVNLFAAEFFSTLNRLRKDKAGTDMQAFMGDKAKNGAAILAFRPEAIKIGAMGLAGGEGIEGVANVKEAHFLGAFWRLRLSVELNGDKPLEWIAYHAGRPLKVSESVPIFVPAEEILSFDEE